MRSIVAMGLAGAALAVSAGAGAAEPPGYVAAREDLAREGRAIVALVQAGKGEAIFARFSPSLARADARVVTAVDGVRDNRPQVEIENGRAPAGNHVVLDLGNGEYALLAHLRRGSVRVRAGQRVRQGDALGSCGNSGNSSEPHLHFHLQDRATLFGAARGLPVVFRGYRADGRIVSRGSPVQEQFFRPLLG